VIILLGYFPRIYDDELIYSILARYYIQSPHLGIRGGLFDLFKDSRAVLIPDFPSNLAVLFKQLSLFNFIELEQFIFTHTPLRYFTTFIEESQCNIIINEIKYQKSKNVQMLTGLVANSIKELKFFKYCPICLENDLESNGESFWRVSHQLPGVLFCSEHQSLLLDSTVIFRYSNAQLLTPTRVTCKSSENTNKFSAYETDLLIKVSIESKKLLLNKSIINVSSLTQKYKEFLREKGYLTFKGNVKQRELYSDFISFYGLNMLDTLQSIPTSEEGSCWLKSITRKHRKSFHPLRHILFLIFLEKEISDLTTSEYNGPFGKGPFPCLNRAANHYKKLVVSNLSIKRCTDTGLPLGIFACTCGFQYTRIGPDKSGEDKFHFRYVRSYGEVWKNKLIDYIDNKKYSFRKTARILEVDVGTIIKYYRMPNKEINESTFKLGADLVRERYRLSWIGTKQENPHWSKTQLRRANSNVYIWLYRNDKNWLNNNSPTKFKHSTKNLRVDWNQRDQELLFLIKKLLLTIDKRKRPNRITKRFLGVSIGKLSWIEKWLGKLPLTKIFIESFSESPYEYREKLVLWKKSLN
jgi:Tn7-like transposition protein D/TniQ